MHFLTCTAVLAALAAAAPAAPQQRFFSLLSLRSASPVHQRSVNANGENFWLGKKTTTFCPEASGLTCPPNTDTTIFSQYGTNKGLGMDTEVPAGQIAYINATDGAFAFNIAHTAVPEDAIKTPFTYSPDPNIPQGAFLGIPGGALACPMGNDVYKIYSDKHYKCKVEKSKCLSISLLAAGTKNNPAWQYE